MATEEGKAVKFKFVVDEQSAQRVNRVLDEMIKRAEQLAKTLQSVGGMGGMGGGGLLGGGTVGGRAPSPQSTLATAGNQTQKVSFSSVLTQNVDAFKRIAQEGGTAMKVLGDAVGRGVDHQRREINKLQASMEGLLRVYGKFSGTKVGESIQDKVLMLQGRIAGHQNELAKLEAMRPPAESKGELLPEIPWPEQQKASLFQRFRGFLNQGGGVGGQPLSLASLSRIPGLGFLGGGIGAAMLAGSTALAVGGARLAQHSFNSAYGAPGIAQDARLDAMTGSLSDYGARLRAGEYSDRRALQAIANDADRRREFEDLTGSGTGFWNWTRRTGTGFSAAGRAFGRGEYGTAISNFFSGTDSIDAQNVLKGKVQEYIQNTTQEMTLHNAVMGEATSNSLGKMGLMRALGIGSGNKRRPDGSTGSYGSWSEKFLNQFPTFSTDEVVSGVQAITQAGSRKAAHSAILGSVLSATGAGLTSAGGLGGVFSRQGIDAGEEAVALLRTLAGKGPQGGVDPSVANLIGEAVAKHADLLGTQFDSSGMFGMLSFGTQGVKGGMIARQNIEGMAEIQRLYAGSRDAAQKAQNFLYARQTAPEAGYYAQSYLATKLDAGRIASIMAGNTEVTAEEAALGITPTMLKDQALRMQASRNFRTMAKGFKVGSDPRNMMEALNKGENLRSYAKRTFAGDDGKWSQEEMDKAIAIRATVLRAGDESLSLKAALGTARDEMFGQGRRLRKGGKGQQAGDVAGGGVEAENARQEAKMREADREYRDTRVEDTKNEIKDKAEAYKKALMNATNLSITAAGTVTIVAPAVNVQNGGKAPSVPGPVRVTPEEAPKREEPFF